jgi:tetratricopeptide (TPR) repeat protein
MQDTQKTIQESLRLEAAERFNEAMQQIHAARRQFPQDRAVAIRHGQLLERTKQFPQALQIYRQLAESKPENQEGVLLIGLARCLVKVSQYEQAAKLFEQLQTKLPDNPDVLTGLAACKRHKNALLDAEQLARKALEADADFKPAVHELAEIQLANKETDAAVATLERNTLRRDIYGDSIDLWLSTLRAQKRERYLQERLEEMAAKFPDRVEFIFALGVQAHRAGEAPLARPAFEKADQLSPNNYRILHEWGVMERLAGDIERSQALLARSLALSPEQPAALRTFGSEHKYVYGDPEFNRLNYAAARLADVPPLDQVQLHYALAKAYEDVSEMDTAFRHYEIAGGKKLRLEPFNERASARLFNLMPQVVNAKKRAEAPQEGCASDVPVFILGMPRSGTSLMEQILSSHPDVFGAGELKFLGAVLDNIQFGSMRLNLNEPEAFFAYDQNAPWAQRGQRYVDKLARLAGKPYKRIVDKMPGNFTMVGLIHAILPNAKIIHSQRHPVETCLSNYRIHFAEGQLWSYNLRTLGRYYVRYSKMMQHWREEFPGAMYEVRYEDNVADVEGQAKKLIDYLGLEWNENCLNFYNLDRPVKTASATQVRKPIYTTSTNRWRKYEKYLGPLLEELGDLVPEYEASIAHLGARTPPQS